MNESLVRPMDVAQRLKNRIVTALEAAYFEKAEQTLDGYKVSRVNDDIVIRDIAGEFDTTFGDRDDAAAKLFTLLSA